MEGVEGHTIGHIIGVKILNLQPIQLPEAVSSFFLNIKSREHREQPPTPPSSTPLLTTKPKQRPVTFSWHLMFYVKKTVA